MRFFDKTIDNPHELTVDNDKVVHFFIYYCT